MLNNIERVMIAAHRGRAGGNIPCNTTPAFEAALCEGADIIELDVSVSADRELFVFHPGMEKSHLKSEKMIIDMPSCEVKKLRYVNQDDTETQFGVELFSDVMRNLKGRCIVNIDKFWTAPKEISEAIRNLGMTEQVIIKTYQDINDLKNVEKYAPDFPYMPMIIEKDECMDIISKMDINCIGAEVCFKSENSEVCSDEFVEKMHASGYKLWSDAIVYDYKSVIGAGHNDDVAVSGNFDDSWGWHIKKGFDIIQTDWPGMLKRYLDSLGK